MTKNVCDPFPTGQNVMQFKIAQQAVEMGLDPTKVESTILEKMRSTGEGYTKVELLVEDVLRSSAEGSVEEPQTNGGKSHPWSSSENTINKYSV